jgi:hypothetical protein
VVPPSIRSGDDGTIGFVRNSLDAKLKQIIDEAIEELFPEPAA